MSDGTLKSNWLAARKHLTEVENLVKDEIKKQINDHESLSLMSGGWYVVDAFTAHDAVVRINTGFKSEREAEFKYLVHDKSTELISSKGLNMERLSMMREIVIEVFNKQYNSWCDNDGKYSPDKNIILSVEE